MNAQAQIAKLKADRRAELKAVQEAAERRRAEQEQIAAQLFNRDVSAALDTLGAAWMIQFYRDGKANQWRDRESGFTYRRAEFAVPGHREIWLKLLHSGEKWVLPDAEIEGFWLACDARRCHQEYHALADALICAEGDPAEPIPF